MKTKEKPNPNKLYTSESSQNVHSLEKPDRMKEMEKDSKLSYLNSLKEEMLLAHSSLFFVLD